MVDYLSRIKQLTIKLGLPNQSKNESGLKEELRNSCSKLLLEDETCSSPEIGKVKMRTQVRERNAVNVDDDHDNDDVFYDGPTNIEDENRFFRYEKAMKATTQKDTQILKSPLVNKRLAKVKRPLVVTRSVPLSPAAIPDKDKILEDKLRADTDYLCGEMVALRQKDQEIAKSLLKTYTEIQKLKVKRSCLQHQELLEEATYEAAEADEVPDMCDAPHKYMSKILLNRGVTKQNLAWRRFSCS